MYVQFKSNNIKTLESSVYNLPSQYFDTANVAVKNKTPRSDKAEGIDWCEISVRFPFSPKGLFLFILRSQKLRWPCCWPHLRPSPIYDVLFSLFLSQYFIFPDYIKICHRTIVLVTARVSKWPLCIPRFLFPDPLSPYAIPDNIFTLTTRWQSELNSSVFRRLVFTVERLSDIALLSWSDKWLWLFIRLTLLKIKCVMSNVQWCLLNTTVDIFQWCSCLVDRYRFPVLKLVVKIYIFITRVV